MNNGYSTFKCDRNAPNFKWFEWVLREELKKQNPHFIRCWKCPPWTVVSTQLSARGSGILIHSYSSHPSLTSHGQNISNHTACIDSYPIFCSKMPYRLPYSFNSTSRSYSTVWPCISSLPPGCFVTHPRMTQLLPIHPQTLQKDHLHLFHWHMSE